MVRQNEEKRALLFGSRALGNAGPASDVVSLQSINDADLLEHIERFGVEITDNGAHT